MARVFGICSQEYVSTRESTCSHKKQDYPISRYLCSYTEDCLICCLTLRRRNNRQHESTFSSSGRWFQKHHGLFEGSWFHPLVLPLKVVLRLRWVILRLILIGWKPKNSEDGLSSYRCFHSEIKPVHPLWGQRLKSLSLCKASEHCKRNVKVLFSQPVATSESYPLSAGSQFWPSFLSRKYNFDPLVFLVSAILTLLSLC